MANQRKPRTGATNKRRKALAAAKVERQHARRAEKAAKRRRRLTITWSLVGLAVVLVVAGLWFWPRGSADEAAAGASATPTATPSPSSSPVDIGCDPAPTPAASPQAYTKAPPATIDKETAYTLTLTTNCGDIAIKTKTAQAPQTVNAILSLADAGYYDNTPCHRLTTSAIYVLQCGDPTGSGSGGPGFTIPDENLPKEQSHNYPKGTVAMANSGADTAGSQFFIVYKDTTLPPDYTIWGTVTKGLDVVEKVAKAGVAGGASDGKPAASIGILSTTVTPDLG